MVDWEHMETRHLIDSVVQQTTALIAQLATSAGLRAPLAHIADQVFLDLSKEIEQQGVTRNVVADMFGMALRTYQKKVNRLRASATQGEQTLWQGVLGHVREQGGATRTQVLAAFRSDDERHVIAVLSDLVASNLLYATGRGQHAAYRATSVDDQRTLFEELSLETLVHMVWLEIGDQPGCTRIALHERFEGDPERIDEALASLLADGRVQVQRDGDEERFRTQRVLVPVGSEAGWETAVFDHFRAVCGAIAAKLRDGGSSADGRAFKGGSTLSFEVHPDHPHEAEVKALLERTREQLFELWERVSQHNQKHPVEESERTKVVFYFGQNVIEANAEEGDAS